MTVRAPTRPNEKSPAEAGLSLDSPPELIVMQDRQQARLLMWGTAHRDQLSKDMLQKFSFYRLNHSAASLRLRTSLQESV